MADRAVVRAGLTMKGVFRKRQGMSLILRPALADDAVALAALKRATFRETFLEEGFAIPYPPQELARFEADAYAVARVAAELADPTHATFVAQEESGALLGYAHAGPCKLPHEQATPEQGELYQLYALRRAQGTGLGRALTDLALDWLARTMPGPVWLGVWSGNVRAQAFYRSYGFVPVGEYGFQVGDWTDREHIMRRAG